MHQVFNSCQKSILKKDLVLSIEKFPSPVLSRPGLLEAWLVLTSVKCHGNL